MIDVTSKEFILQSRCNASIHNLEKTISRIKTACNEPDFDTADRLFKTALVDAMTDIIIDVIPATELFQYIEEIEEKSSQAV